MKTKLFILLTLAIWVFAACEEKIDIAKEEVAIKAAYEAEKTAYLKQDAAAMGEFWVQDASSQKIWFSEKGENAIVGWENINASQQKEVADTTWDRSLITCTFSDYKIDISEESAWITSKTNWKGTYKGQQADMNQSRIAVMKKVDGKWKFALMAIYNYPMEEKAVTGETTGEGMQIELHKRFIGNWKCEMAKDTTGFWDVKPYGTGLEGYYKFVSKGKILMEGKQIWGYNKVAAKVTIGEIMKGVDNAVYSSWFDSETTCIMKYYGPVSISGNEIPEWKMEFKTPDMFLQTTIINNKSVRTDIWKRVR